MIDGTLKSNLIDFQEIFRSINNASPSTEVIQNRNEITIKIEDLENIVPQTPPNENNARIMTEDSATIDCRYKLKD